ncbi:hypothetical protein N665_0037s0028 [Sinapis alba]|nr:hypothetical protein N665_0037s0028 [Sinapis alba]
MSRSLVLDPPSPRRMTYRLCKSSILLHMDAFINVLRQRYTNDPHLFRSERMCILDHAFSQWWTSKYLNWVSSEPNANGLGRRLPGGGGRFIWRCLNYKNNHWLAIWISIHRRHIVVWNNIVGYIRQAQLYQVMAPFVNMVLYLLVKCAATIEERCKYSLAPFTYEVADAPQCESEDCGLFALKYIECHAFGLPFPGALQHKNNKAIREHMAVDIFEEIPNAHKTEVTDIDVNQDIRLPPDDFNQKTSTKRISDEFQTTSRKLQPDDVQKTSTRRHTDDFQTTYRRLPDDF